MKWEYDTASGLLRNERRNCWSRHSVCPNNQSPRTLSTKATSHLCLRKQPTWYRAFDNGRRIRGISLVLEVRLRPGTWPRQLSMLRANGLPYLASTECERSTEYQARLFRIGAQVAGTLHSKYRAVWICPKPGRWQSPAIPGMRNKVARWMYPTSQETPSGSTCNSFLRVSIGTPR